jgi:uncharacterized membrane protein YqgA involved in biofilm formation
MPGLGTLINVCTVLAGSGIGVLLGARFSQRIRDVVTDGVGLVVLLVAVLDGANVISPALRRSVGSSAPVLIVLGSVLLGGIVGSAIRIEDRLDRVGGALQRVLARRGADVEVPGGHEVAGARAVPAVPAVPAFPRARPLAPKAEGIPHPDGALHGQRERFIQGFVTASVIYCVGPLTILGSIQDGLGQGFSQLALKSVLDGFTSIALAASLGWGVAAAALSVLVVQGSLTAAAAAAGNVMTSAEIAAMTATGGLLLVGLALRLLRVRAIPVADLLPALVVAPLMTGLVATLR